MYKSVIRKTLFKFDPEDVHHFTFSILKTFFKFPFLQIIFYIPITYKMKNVHNLYFMCTKFYRYGNIKF